MNLSSGMLAPHEPGGLGVEVVELALDDRDHVAGDVLVDLGVLERADPALAGLVLVADLQLVLGGDALGDAIRPPTACSTAVGSIGAVLHKS